MRADDGEDQSRRGRRVGRVAARAQHLDRRLAGEGVARGGGAVRPVRAPGRHSSAPFEASSFMPRW